MYTPSAGKPREIPYRRETWKFATHDSTCAPVASSSVTAARAGWYQPLVGWNQPAHTIERAAKKLTPIQF
jgi:hypothetical protein